MIELNNITLGEYLDLEDKSEYNFAMKFAFRYKNPKDEFGIKNISEVEFGIIKDYQYLAESKQLTIFNEVSFLCDMAKVKSMGCEKLDKICRALFWVSAEINKLIKIETRELAYEPTSIEMMAGIESFNGFGVFIQIDSLAGGDPVKYEKIRKLPYHVCFAKLLLNKKNNEFQKRYNEILTERQRNL